MDECKYDHRQEVECHKPPDLLIASDGNAHGDFRAAGGLEVDMEARYCKTLFAQFGLGFRFIGQART